MNQKPTPLHQPERPIPDEALVPFGFTRGSDDRWCVTCRRVKPGLARNSFKCRSCAADAFRAMERADERRERGL